MIEVHHLSKKYGSLTAIQDLNFSVEKGEIVGLLGVNGAGKTTTMRIMTCFLRPTSGTVKIDGCDVLTQSLAVRKRIGYLPEHSPLYLDMKVEEYLNYRLKLKKFPRKDRRTRLGEILEICHLEKRRKQLIGELSKGYRQRVGFADAISHRPPLLILDEPTAGMDPASIIEFRNLIRNLAEEHTVIFSTHILPEVDILCKRVVIIHRGHIKADNSTSELRQQAAREGKVILETDAGREELERELKPLNLDSLECVTEGEFSRYRLHPGADSQDDLRDQLYQVVKKQDWRVRSLGREEKTLEELFIKITSE